MLKVEFTLFSTDNLFPEKCANNCAVYLMRGKMSGALIS